MYDVGLRQCQSLRWVTGRFFCLISPQRRIYVASVMTSIVRKSILIPRRSDQSFHFFTPNLVDLSVDFGVPSEHTTFV